MTSYFDQLPERRSTESVKWRAYGKDVLPMWVADMDFRSPEPVIRALTERVAHGIYGYPDVPDDLRRVVVHWLAKRHDWQVKPEWLVFIPGIVTGLNMAAQAFVKAGEGILIQPPVYMPFLDVPQNAGAIRQEALLRHEADGTYSIDFEAFEQAITPQTHMFILCNPHNPVGRVFRRDELERLAEICLRHHVLILSDEIHSDLIFSGQKHLPLASLNDEIASQTITLIAPSKTFNIAGLSCSVAVISDLELRKQFQLGAHGMVHGVNVLGLTAAQAAYESGEPWLDELLVYLEGNRNFLTEFVQKELPGVSMTAPEGTYLAWLDCAQAHLTPNPARYFLEHARVAVNEGEAFGAGGKDFVRLNFGCPRSMLTDALERMRKSIQK